MYRAPHQCPICGEKLTITEITCDACGTRMQGKFDGCRFCALSPEEAGFLLTFIRNRGSIKDVERELGVSYPTVRAALDNLIAALDRDEGADMLDRRNVAEENVEQTPEVLPREAKIPDVKGKARRKILDRLARHEITAEEAAAQLKKL
ncbi:MAG: DUF2089 domain-containing protein [Ruminococcaceae bacterium]|nr:DUF2089 domain-containing protein [Oscillospiraceae bacterium]